MSEMREYTRRPDLVYMSVEPSHSLYTTSSSIRQTRSLSPSQTIKGQPTLPPYSTSPSAHLHYVFFHLQHRTLLLQTDTYALFTRKNWSKMLRVCIELAPESHHQRSLHLYYLTTISTHSLFTSMYLQ